MATKRILFLYHYDDALLDWADRAAESGFETQTLRVGHASDLERLDGSDFDFVVEWLPVKNGLKQQALIQLEALLPGTTPILSTAHEQLAGQIAAGLSHPERLFGFCPMGLYRRSNVISLVETPHHASDPVKAVKQYLKDLQVIAHFIQDTPGLVLPRIYAMLANEAAFTLQEGVAAVSDIDTAMRLGTNYAVGPLQWADQVGVDVVLSILENLWQVYREERYRPCLLLQKMVLVGHLGMRTGRGFYHYPHSQTRPEPDAIEATSP